MNTGGRRVLVLGLLACLLGGYTYWTTPLTQGLNAPAGARGERPVLEFAPERVTQIDLLFDEQHLVCQRTAGGWQQVPDGKPLRQDVVDDFLTNLRKLVNLGEVEIDPTQLAEFGLQPPESRVVLTLEGEETRTLALGKRNPVQSSLYAQVNDSPQVVLVGAVVLWDMRKLVTAANRVG
jgi:hypothetical protein